MSAQTEYITKGSSQFSVLVGPLLQDNSGSNPGDPLTGLVYNSTNLVCYYKSGGTGTVTALTLATQTSSGAFSLGGFAQLSSANMPGMYRLDLSTTLFSSGDNVGLVTLAGYADLASHAIHVKFTDLDLYSSIQTELATYGPSTHTSTDIQDLLPSSFSSVGVSSGYIAANAIAIANSTAGADNVITNITNLDAAVSNCSTHTSTAITDALTSYAPSTHTTTDINDQVLDVLKTDTSSLPGQGAPTATPTLEAAIMYLYKSWRNKKDQDGSTTQLYADDGSTVDQKQTTSVSSGVVTKGEFQSGP